MLSFCLVILLAYVIISIMQSYIYFMGIIMSKRIHKKIIERLLLASFTKFYNMIMTGRLMNRLSKDIFTIDVNIPE